jgi:hypothetical protein
MPIKTRWHIGQARLYLAARPLLAQHNTAALIQTDDVERGLADIVTDYGDRAVEIVGHGVLLVFGAPCQIRGWRGRSTAGPSH